jgi:hypothetical protein
VSFGRSAVAGLLIAITASTADSSSESSVAQRDEAAHRGTDADDATVASPCRRDERVDVVHLPLSQRREPAAHAVPAKVGGVERDAGAGHVAPERDDLGVALRSGEPVPEHDGDLRMARSVCRGAEVHTVARRDVQRRSHWRE